MRRPKRLFLMLLVPMLLLASGTATAAYKICIDAGHGGTDPGAVGCGLEEEDVNLQVAGLLRDLLVSDPDFSAIMTRTSDATVSLSARTEYANDNGANRFVSIHCNAFDGTATGIETYCYTYGSSYSFDQRDNIQAGMTEAWPSLPDRGGKTATYYVIKYTSMPGTLSELAFIDHCSTDATYLSSATKLQQAAEAHHQALRASVGLSTTDNPVDPEDPPVTPTNGMLLGVVFEDLGVGTADMSVRIANASVTAAIGSSSVSTNTTSPDAAWAVSVPPGTYTVTASATGYWTDSRTCTVVAGVDNWCSVGLSPKTVEPPVTATGTLVGIVFEEHGLGIADMSVRLYGASVTVIGPSGPKNFTADSLQALWSMEALPGDYTITASYPGYWTNSRTCTVYAGDENWCSVGLFVKETTTPPAVGLLSGVIFEDQGEGQGDMTVRLPGAIVHVWNYQTDTTAAAAQPDGFFTFSLPPATYNVDVTAPGFWPNSRICTVSSAQTAWCSVGLFTKDQPNPLPPDSDISTPVEPDVWSPPEADILTEEDQSQPQDEEDLHQVLPDVNVGPGVDTGSGNGGTGPIPLDPGEETDETVTFEYGNGCTQSNNPDAAPLVLLAALVWLGLLRSGRRILGKTSLAGFLVLALFSCQEPEVPSSETGRSALSLGTAATQTSSGLPWRLTDVQPVTATEGFTAPVWSPDGLWLAVASESLDALYVVSASGGEPSVVAQGPGVGLTPWWSLDSQSVGYRHLGQRSSDVPMFAVNREGQSVRPLAHRTPETKVLVEEDQVFVQKGKLRVHASQGSEKACCAVQSFDGRFLVFLDMLQGLVLVRTQDNASFPLGQGTHPSFSQDSTLLVFDRCRDDGSRLTECALLRVDLSSAVPSPELIQSSSSLATHPAISPAGQTLVFEVDGVLYRGRLVR